VVATRLQAAGGGGGPYILPWAFPECSLCWPWWFPGIQSGTPARPAPCSAKKFQRAQKTEGMTVGPRQRGPNFPLYYNALEHWPPRHARRRRVSPKNGTGRKFCFQLYKTNRTPRKVFVSGFGPYTYSTLSLWAQWSGTNRNYSLLSYSIGLARRDWKKSIFFPARRCSPAANVTELAARDVTENCSTLMCRLPRARAV